jgi:A/G-specific adenine glycosylase
MRAGLQSPPLPSSSAFSWGVSPRYFRRALLRWYDAEGRDLPWRKTRDPYPIWISEIMLQQTRVAAVLEHYRVFLERFPTVQKLAAASESAVLAAWSGLGYYRRARMLLRCAQKVVRDCGGRFPETAQALRELPGIGRYTAAAIASIAFGEPVAVVDGNVERVLQRLLGRDVAAKEAWDLAQALLETSRPGDFNQAMMELGATVCVPRGPKCDVCPVRKWCKTQGEEPRAAAPARQTKKQMWCLLEQCDGERGDRVRLVQRSRTHSLMAGMWELPSFAREVSGVRVWRTFRHSITATDYTVHVARNVVKRPKAAARGKWFAAEKMTHIPLTGLARKILRAAGII